jgi:hypothetical protein
MSSSASVVSPKHSDDGDKESGAINGTEYFSQEPHYIHDNMIDAPPGHHPDDIHDSVGDVSITPNTEDLFDEQDTKENVEVRSKINLLSTIEDIQHIWKHHDIALWSLLQDIMWTPILSNQYLLPVAQLVPYTQMYSQCGKGLQEPIQQNSQHKETLRLLHLTVLQCLNSMENHNNSPAIQTNGDVGVDGIMELDPGPMENDHVSNSGDHKNSSTGTMCYDFLTSYLVLSDHMISAFQQQGHQAFPLVKLKDHFTNALGNTFHSLLPMVPICLDHTFAQNSNLHSHTALFDHFQPCHGCLPAAIIASVTNMGRYHFYDKSPNEYSFMDEDLGLTTDESNFVNCLAVNIATATWKTFRCMHVYGHNIILSFHPSLGELQYCFQ